MSLATEKNLKQLLTAQEGHFFVYQYLSNVHCKFCIAWLSSYGVVVRASALQLVDLGSRGGVLEDTFWSPWSWPRKSSPWPWPQSLKSSKIALSSARGQHYFLNRLNLVGKRQKPRGKFAKTFFVFLNWRSPENKLFKTYFAWKKFWRPFFVFEYKCTCVLGPWPWPRIFFVSLALSFVSSTPPLLGSFPCRVIPQDFSNSYSQLPCLTFSIKGTVWRFNLGVVDIQ